MGYGEGWYLRNSDQNDMRATFKIQWMFIYKKDDHLHNVHKWRCDVLLVSNEVSFVTKWRQVTRLDLTLDGVPEALCDTVCNY